MEIPSLLQTGSASQPANNIAAAEAIVRRYCGWHVAPVIIEDLILDGSGTNTLFLRTMHLRDIISAEVSGTTLDVSTLEWSQAGYVRLPGGWPDRLRSVKVTIEHGFDEASDVAQIIRDIAGRADASQAYVVREQAGQVSIAASQVASGVSGGVVLMDHERRMLDLYRLPGRL